MARGVMGGGSDGLAKTAADFECTRVRMRTLLHSKPSQVQRLPAENGLPVPTRQFHLPWRQPENGWVDFAYLVPRVILEADGRNWHTRLEQMANDRRRDREVQLHGYDLYRYTWDELQNEPGLVAELLPIVTAR